LKEQYLKYLCSHTGGGPLAGVANKGRPNWSKPNGGRSTKFGGGRLSGGGGPNGRPKAVSSIYKTHYLLTQYAVALQFSLAKQQLKIIFLLSHATCSSTSIFCCCHWIFHQWLNSLKLIQTKPGLKGRTSMDWCSRFITDWTLCVDHQQCQINEQNTAAIS